MCRYAPPMSDFFFGGVNINARTSHGNLDQRPRITCAWRHLYTWALELLYRDSVRISDRHIDLWRVFGVAQHLLGLVCYRRLLDPTLHKLLYIRVAFWILYISLHSYKERRRDLNLENYPCPLRTYVLLVAGLRSHFCWHWHSAQGDSRSPQPPHAGCVPCMAAADKA